MDDDELLTDSTVRIIAGSIFRAASLPASIIAGMLEKSDSSKLSRFGVIVQSDCSSSRAFSCCIISDIT